MIELAVTPSPLWYADRGTGAVTMVLLTASVVLGMGTTVRWKSPVWPKYISVPLHQNVSILIIFFLVVEPHGLARLWQIGKQKLRVWPFPY